MRRSHISTGKHLESDDDPRFRINTSPGLMEPKYGVNEAHGSYLQRGDVVELRDELNAWLEANPSAEEVAARERAEAQAHALDEAADEFAVMPHPYEGGVTEWLRERAAVIRAGVPR